MPRRLPSEKTNSQKTIEETNTSIPKAEDTWFWKSNRKNKFMSNPYVIRNGIKKHSGRTVPRIAAIKYNHCIFAPRWYFEVTYLPLALPLAASDKLAPWR